MKRNALRKKNVNLVVNPESRTVVAYVTDCTYDAIEDVLNQTWLGKNMLLHGAETEIRPAEMMKTYRAVAKCHPQDTFDLEKGQEIAMERLNEKYGAAKEKAIRRFMKRQDKLLEQVIYQSC